MNSIFGKIWLAAMVLTLPIVSFSQKIDALEKTEKLAGEIVAKSYPELKAAKIEFKIFKSGTNFFKSQFSVARFMTLRKMRYAIFVNPEVFRRNAPEEGVRAILAHELAHILYYKRKNRVELVGLAGLMNQGFTVKFERRADLEALARGYGEGLKAYRAWLYENIPATAVAAKRRDYFSPEEIDKMLEILSKKTQMLDVWRKKVPRNLREIEGVK